MGAGAEGESVTAEGAACEKLAAKRAAARNIWFSSVAAGSGKPSTRDAPSILY